MAMTKTKKPAKKTTKPKERAEKAERERDEWKARHDTLADVSRKCIATAERERDEARANYAFMVERAANQKLDGYRELGARAAAAEERAERAERERDEARAEREREERLEALGRAIVEASRFFQDADDIALSEDVTIWEDDCHGGDHRTVLIMDDNQHALLADVSEAVATYREETAGVDVRSDEIKELRKRAEKAERERDEARAERDARPDISAEDARAFMMFKPVPARDSREGPVMHAIRAHAAKAGKP